MAEDEKDKQKKEVETSFLLLGLASLLSWNAILSQLDFFMFYQKDHHPEIVYGNINFFIILTLQLILLATKRCFSYKTLFYFSLCGFMFSLITLPISAIYFPADIGFKISCVVIFINGFSNAVISSSMFGLVSFFPVENIIAVGTGQGISGILMTLIRYAILLFIDEKKGLNIGAYLFFGISALILLFVLRQVMVLYKNPIFISYLEQIGEIKGGNDENGDTKLIEQKDIELKEIGEEKQGEKNETKKDKGLLYLIMKILDINIMVMLCYIITIGLFPGACIRPNLFGLSPGWKINTIIFLYNLFDTVGRKLVGYIKKPTKCHLITTTILRFFFLCSFPLVIYLEKYNILNTTFIGVLSALNTVLMALTNGIANNLCFSLAPEQVQGELKAKAGSSVSLCLAVGLFLGSFLANVMDKINNNI